MPFRPRHALLTGAAGAIGGALTRILAERHPELRFTLVDRDATGLAAWTDELKERCVAQPWDLAAANTLPELWQRAVGASGAIDLLVNCAGIMEIRSFAATSWELGERLLTVDLISPLRLMQLAVSGMPQTGGWIVNISSMAGRVPIRGCSYYGAAKSGLALASQIVGLELAEKGVHVLTVLPGPVSSQLESRARAQVPSTLITRRIPTGDPKKLAHRIERALRVGKKRVVYPAIYQLGDVFNGLGSRFTASFSPHPTDR